MKKTFRLMNEFHKIKKDPMFEIQLGDEFYVYNINATRKGLELGGVSNSGFHSHGLEIVEWEDDYSLDYHLEGLYEIAYNDAMEQYNTDTDELGDYCERN